MPRRPQLIKDQRVETNSLCPQGLLWLSIPTNDIPPSPNESRASFSWAIICSFYLSFRRVLIENEDTSESSFAKRAALGTHAVNYVLPPSLLHRQH